MTTFDHLFYPLTCISYFVNYITDNSPREIVSKRANNDDDYNNEVALTEKKNTGNVIHG